MSILAVAPAHVLVIDDDPLLCDVISVLLSTGEYETRFLTNGREALERIRAERPAVVILDVVMPGTDGFAVCEQIKADPELSGTTVIILTALDGAHERERGARAGADAYLTKPFSPLGLLEVLARHTQGR